MTNDPSRLTLAVRAYPRPLGKTPHRPARQAWTPPECLLILDTETRTDAAQALTFGSYRFVDQGACVEEGLIYADDLPPEELAILREYVRRHPADVARGEFQTLRLRSRREFMDRVFLRLAYEARALVVGFNLPFDLSRLCVDAAPARDPYVGAFSFALSVYGVTGQERPNPHKPRLIIKQIDSKRALMQFAKPLRPAAAHRDFRGHFLDLRALAFALTDQSYSLARACEAFGVEHGKQEVEAHGVVTPAYIDYNRRDVLATYELALKLLAEFATHPIALEATKAYSPAAIGKAYLHAMGIPPILVRQPDFPAARLGHAITAFYGGRASARIRKTAVPVVYTDFLSMYPTVNALMRLWRFVTAARIRVRDDAVQDVTAFLRGLRAEDLFRPDTWPKLTGFVRLIPNGDLLPTRAQYDGHDWQIAVNRLHAASDSPDDALWYALPDVAASVLHTGHVPHIVDAFYIEPEGTLPHLAPTSLAGRVRIHPRERDFFTTVIEERKRVAGRSDWTPAERDRTSHILKILANATSYGIYAEMHQQERDEPMQVTCHGIDADPFACRVAHPEVAGEYCFPPLASLITAGARLMLALLEYAVVEAGGAYAMEDTDSMAIVATESGGLVACEGGPHRMPDGGPAVRALSWAQVRDLAGRFAALNPYDRSAVPGSVLKIEGENFDSQDQQRQLYCYAISAKRYALFTRTPKGVPQLIKNTEHGLGHLRNPTDVDSDDRDWIAQDWLTIIRRALGCRTRALPFADRPAMTRVTVSSPEVLRPLTLLNHGKPYAEQIKPFNFLLSPHIRALGHADGTDPERFHLIAPYESDPARWTEMQWIDQYSGDSYRITTEGHHGGRGVVRVKTYADVLEEFEWHAESKYADANGEPADQQTIGLLHRRRVTVRGIKHIGKESNHLEAVEAGMIHDPSRLYTEYPDPNRDEWEQTRRVLDRIPLQRFEEETGMGRRVSIDARAGRRLTRLATRRALIALAKKLHLI